jgi:hypothetical protein
MPERSVADHAALSKQLQRRAEECRALAEKITAHRASYLRLAETYDDAAKQADQVARDIETLKGRFT